MRKTTILIQDDTQIGNVSQRKTWFKNKISFHAPKKMFLQTSDSYKSFPKNNGTPKKSQKYFIINQDKPN